MNTFRIVSVATLASIIIGFSPLSQSEASYGGGYGGQYGGPYGSGDAPADCRLAIDQMVSYPTIVSTIEYVDNITPSTAKYSPNQAVIARVKVINLSNRIIPSVTVTNHIPACFAYIAGPGTLNKDTNVLTIPLGDLNSQEERIFYITYKAGDESCLPAESLYCAPNKMIVSGDVCSAEDVAQLCIERQVLGASTTTTKGGQSVKIKQMPATGAAFDMAFVALQAMMGGMGLFLKKKGQI